MGLLLAVSVTATSVLDPAAAHPVVASEMRKYPDIKTLYVDSAYAGQCAQTVSQLHDAQVQVVRHPTNKRDGWRLYLVDTLLRNVEAATAMSTMCLMVDCACSVFQAMTNSSLGSGNDGLNNSSAPRRRYS